MIIFLLCIIALALVYQTREGLLYPMLRIAIWPFVMVLMGVLLVVGGVLRSKEESKMSWVEIFLCAFAITVTCGYWVGVVWSQQ